MTESDAGLSQIAEMFKDRFFDADGAQKNYGVNTIGFTLPILGAVKPIHQSEIIKIVKIANEYKIPLYPFSTGHNWGYGGGTPNSANGLILDLSLMNKIIDIDSSTGSITIEPGVTQGQLKKYLEENQLPFIVPVTGAGPTCSLLGNALDRGYGLTPITDHFYGIISLEAVLANGQIYRSALSEMNGFASFRLYKWGVGPYIDGLFAQSSFGIVTSATIALAPQPEYTEGFLFYINSDENFALMVDEIRSILQEVGATLGSIKITNQHRLLAISEFMPEKIHSKEILMDDPEIIKFLAKKDIPLWLGSGVILGKKTLVKAAKKIIRARLKKYSHKILFLNPGFFNRLVSLLTRVPIINNTSFIRVVKKLNLFLQLLSGVPSEMALPIAYFKSGKPIGKQLNPDQDGCGLIWFSPLLPIKSEDIKVFVKKVNEVCHGHHIEPVITVSTLSDRCFDSAVPLIFNRDDPESLKNAHKCYEALFTECQKMGYVPYRLPANFMKLAIQSESPYWQLVKKIKAVFDPNNIMSPGRYS